MAPQAEVSRRGAENRRYDRQMNSNPPRGRGDRHKNRRRPKPRWIERGMGLDLGFLLLVFLLLIIGMFMMFSASYPKALNDTGDSLYYIKRQLIFALIGIVVMLLLSVVNYEKLKRFALWILLAGYVMLGLVLVWPSKTGVHRWIEIAGFTIQASEIMKFAIILFLAFWASKYYDRMYTFSWGVLPGGLVFVLAAGMLLLEPHFSGIVIIGILTVVMLFIGGVKPRYFIIGGVFLGLAVLIAWATGLLGYAMERMDGWGQALNPPPELYQTTWQTRNSLYAIGSGGFFGLGLGQSRQKYLYLPEPQNDFVFAIICEELGFLGAFIILLIFALLVWRGITLSLRAKDRFGKLLGIGLSSQIGIQVVLNILVITDWLPNTGISLPFFSYGGSSLIMLLAQMGIILSISRTANIEKT